MQITFETRKRNNDFIFWGKEFQRDAPAKDMLVLNKSSLGPGIEVIPGVGVVGLVTNKELCRVIWGIILKSFMHKYSFLVIELLR